MSDHTTPSVPNPLPLPDNPNLDWLRKEAKRRLAELRATEPAAKLADAQFAVARAYGFASWRALKAHIDSLSIDGQLEKAARDGDAATLGALLDAHPDRLHTRLGPYEFTLLHAAAQGHQLQGGHLATVDLLLRRGIDANVREKGDNTYPMHWAAAAGKLDIVRRLADAGGDVVGHGDDHALEVIGWASCWDGTDDDAHRAVVDFLISRGARHHIFSAIAMRLPDEVRRIVRANPAALQQTQSHNEGFQLPLHFAVRMQRPGMVSLLLELGADPHVTDVHGFTAAAYAETPDADRAVFEAIAARGEADMTTALVLGDFDTAARLLRADPARVTRDGVLHLMSKRGDTRAVQWLLDHGVDANAIWSHWDSDVTPLHLAVLGNHPDVVRALLRAGADPTIRDTKHDANASDWAEFFGRGEILTLLRD